MAFDTELTIVWPLLQNSHLEEF